MRRTITRRAIVIRAAALGAAAPFANHLLADPRALAQSGDPILIGAPYNLTGGLSSVDQPAADGSLLAVEEINAAGGVLGRPIELIVYDGKSDLPTMSALTKKLVTSDKVVAIVGLTDTSHMKASGPIAQQNQVPFLDVAGTAPVITSVGDYIFMLPFGDNVQAAVAAEFAKEQGWTTCAMLVDESTDYTKYLAKYFDERFTAEDIGGTVVSRLAFNMGDTDFSAQLTKFKNLDPQPDFWFVSANPGEVGTIVKQARDMGYQGPIVGGDGFDTPLLAELAGPVNEVYFTTHQGIYDQSEKAEAFIAAYEAKYGTPPENVFPALGYDGIYLMANAIETAGSTDGPAIRDALAATSGWEGVTGTISYAEGSRIPSKSVALIQVKDGKNELLEIVVPEVVPGA